MQTCPHLEMIRSFFYSYNSAAEASCNHNQWYQLH